MIYSQGGIQNASPLLLNVRTAAGAVKSGTKGAKAAGQSVGKARRVRLKKKIQHIYDVV